MWDNNYHVTAYFFSVFILMYYSVPYNIKWYLSVPWADNIQDPIRYEQHYHEVLLWMSYLNSLRMESLILHLPPRWVWTSFYSFYDTTLKLCITCGPSNIVNNNDDHPIDVNIFCTYSTNGLVKLNTLL